MKAPRRVRLIFDKNGRLMDGFEADRFGLAYVRRQRASLASDHPDRAPLASRTYTLADSTTRALITLPAAKRKR
jgi:hypothetical protein